MAKTTTRAGKRALAAGRDRPRTRKSGGSKAPGSRQPKPAKSAAPKQKRSLASESARLKSQLKAARVQTKQAVERQTATAEILKVIASSPSDVLPVFDTIVTNAKRLIGGLTGSAFRFIEGVAHLVAFTPLNPAGDEALCAAFPRPIADVEHFRRVATGEILQVADTEDQPDTPLKEVGRTRGYRSILFVPLKSPSGTIGTLVVTRRDPGSFSTHHVQLLQAFADQAVIAIENTRLFNETKEALERQTATAEILRVISRSPTDIKPVFDAIALTAVRLLGCDRSFILLRDGKSFWSVASCGPEGQLPTLSPSPVPIDPAANFPSRAIVDRKTLHLPDWSTIELPEFERAVRDRLGISSSLYLPLLRDGECIGLLGIAHKRANAFDVNDTFLAESFRDQALIAIENTRLFDEVQARTRELSASLENLRATQDRLIQTEKLASLGQLTAGIAHEIKNPLNFVNNFSTLSAELVDEMTEVLADAGIEAKKREELDEIRELLKSNLEKVVQHGKRADSIVKNMLLHSRQGAGELRSVEINALVDESMNLAYHGARAENTDFNIALGRDFDPKAGLADVYPQEITRVLLNVISNGFYAAARRALDVNAVEPKLWVATKDMGDKVEIRVRDNGAGIADEVKDKIFNPFFTTKPAGEGTGLGLSMSHDIVAKQHGGTIEVDTVVGAFTEFRIVLPRTGTSQAKSGG